MTEPAEEAPRDTDLPPEPVSADPDEAQVPPTPDGDRAPASADRVLPRSPDESDVGWGGRPEDDDERFRREVPPHW